MNEGTYAESHGPLLAAMWRLTDLENVISVSDLIGFRVIKVELLAPNL